MFRKIRVFDENHNIDLIFEFDKSTKKLFTIIGLNGSGKTRLIKSLFESDKLIKIIEFEPEFWIENNKNAFIPNSFLYVNKDEKRWISNFDSCDFKKIKYKELQNRDWNNFSLLFPLDNTLDKQKNFYDLDDDWNNLEDLTYGPISSLTKDLYKLSNQKGLNQKEGHKEITNKIQEIINPKSLQRKLNYNFSSKIISSYSSNDSSFMEIQETNDTNKIHNFNERSFGRQKFIHKRASLEGLVLNKADENTTVIIEHPENNLEPKLQKEFKKIIDDYSKSHNIIMTTHSPYMINLEKDKNDIKVVFKEDGIFKAKNYLDLTEKEIEKYTFINDENSDWNLKKHPVFLEGITDKIAFDLLFRIYEEKFKKKIRRNYIFIPLNGASKCHLLFNTYLNEKIKYIGILDSDTAGDEAKNHQIKNNMSNCYTLKDINSKWDKKEIEDIFFINDSAKATEYKNNKIVKWYELSKKYHSKNFECDDEEIIKLSEEIVNFIQSKFQ